MADVQVRLLVFVHVAAGLACLLAGAVALLARPKGQVLHRLTGRAFARLITVVGATAFGLLVFRFNTFFFVLAVFSFYLAFSGVRVLDRKRPDRGQAAKPIDVWAAWTTVIVAVAAIGLRLAGVLGDDAAVVLGVLSASVATAVYDLWRFARPEHSLSRRNVWLVEHLAKMGGAYIAISSAFSATVLTFLPHPLGSIWPALVGTPPLIFVARRYWLRLNRRDDQDD
jgi:uncharacterized membrane protein